MRTHSTRLSLVHPAAVLAVCLAAGCGSGDGASSGTPTEPLPTTSTFAFSSDAADPIGRGASVSASAPGSYFTGLATRFVFDNSTPTPLQNYLSLSVSTPSGVGYALNLILPRGQVLHNGTFDSTLPYNKAAPNETAFEFGRHDATCGGGLRAHVVVSDLKLNADQITVDQVRVQWQQWCDATPNASVRGDWTFIASRAGP